MNTKINNIKTDILKNISILGNFGRPFKHQHGVFIYTCDETDLNIIDILPAFGGRHHSSHHSICIRRIKHGEILKSGLERMSQAVPFIMRDNFCLIDGVNVHMYSFNGSTRESYIIDDLPHNIKDFEAFGYRNYMDICKLYISSPEYGYLEYVCCPSTKTFKRVNINKSIPILAVRLCGLFTNATANQLTSIKISWIPNMFKFDSQIIKTKIIQFIEDICAAMSMNKEETFIDFSETRAPWVMSNTAMLFDSTKTIMIAFGSSRFYKIPVEYCNTNSRFIGATDTHAYIYRIDKSRIVRCNYINGQVAERPTPDRVRQIDHNNQYFNYCLFANYLHILGFNKSNELIICRIPADIDFDIQEPRGGDVMHSSELINAPKTIAPKRDFEESFLEKIKEYTHVYSELETYMKNTYNLKRLYTEQDYKALEKQTEKQIRKKYSSFKIEYTNEEIIGGILDDLHKKSKE